METAREQGERVPALESRPDLDSELIFYLSLFSEIQNARRYTYGSPLRLSDKEIYDYLMIHSVPGKLECIHQIKVIDKAWYSVDNARREKEMEKARKKSSSKPKSPVRPPRKR